MNDNEIFERFKNVLLRDLDFMPDEIKLESHLVRDMRCDKTDIYDLKTYLEREFQIEDIDNRELENLSIKEAIDLIKNKLSVSPSNSH